MNIQKNIQKSKFVFLKKLLYYCRTVKFEIKWKKTKKPN